MSATLQIIAVMKMLGVITLKDHSLAPVSQGTKAMDTIVQVKFFDFFQVHLKLFSTIRLSLRGNCWNVLKSMRKRECVLTVTDYIWRILHGGAKIWREEGGVALEPYIFFREARSPIASLLEALILFYCRAWSPQNVCCGARSPKY